MSLTIDHSSEMSFRIPSLEMNFKVDLPDSVKEKLAPREKLTNESALTILKSIKWKSDVLSFLTKPMVAIPLSMIVLACGLLMPSAGLILSIASIFISTLGGGMTGFSIINSYTEFLPDLSNAYRDQSRLAGQYIEQIKASDQELTFLFA